MSLLLRIFTLFVASLLMCPFAEGRTTNNANKIRKEQQAARKALQTNKKKLAENKREISSQRGQLRSLEKEIGARSLEIDKLQGEVTSIDQSIDTTTAAIDSLNLELENLRAGYTAAMRRFQAQMPVRNPLSFLFSARSVDNFLARVRWLREFSRWRKTREREIQEASAMVAERRSELTQKRSLQSDAITRLNSNKAMLRHKQSQTDRLVKKLEADGSQMKTEISRREKQLANLDRQLNRIIEADRVARQKKEAAAKAKSKAKSGKKATSGSKNKSTTAKGKSSSKAAGTQEAPLLNADYDRQLTGSFESNKGRLLFPVSGRYRVVRKFGSNNYSDRVRTSRLGIDIEVPAGTGVRAIFDGVVTNVSYLDGFNNIAVIRHGNYLTVYVNLASVSVAAGQKVSKGQALGTVARDEADGSTGMLQFSIRKERQELNPLLWVK